MRTVAYHERVEQVRLVRCFHCSMAFYGDSKSPCPQCGIPVPPPAPRNVNRFIGVGPIDVLRDGWPVEEEGDERTIMGFLWLPRFIAGERRWLTVEAIRQRFYLSGQDGGTWRWIDVAWDDEFKARQRGGGA